MHNQVFCLMGPTASGKTALASQLVQQFPFEIISVDSAMIYREMNIGTAKPDENELAGAPHHLIDILNPNESYSAARFCDDVIPLINAIRASGNWPLLVGGTMMYFNALQKGLSELPVADVSVRSELSQRIASEGLEPLYSELLTVDAFSASRIHANDSQRIQRALEVYYTTGKPLSAFLQQQDKKHQFSFINWGLFPDNRAWLHERIAMRFDLMLDQGFLDEVKQLQNKWSLTMDYPSMRCVGYRQALGYLAGEYSSFEEFRMKGIAATRQLAKRQLTWLRSWAQIDYFPPEESNTMQKVIANIHKIMDNS
ncbi:tRNA delta(2)-isopentenylpyrophosphate transferase [Legionella quinlivanii]|uniref:tRNA dimethylallyltransferase n=1 Tax=Legionella quinlivanii TaxID=45073 RepID=A0A0W0Y0I6_9GAMM|nr:tRNA (adenosine(37)-N6)-dimethylallyltransferase MiaA [Legionella quinlivanii]KTD50393.1 tRNA delta(2)-isopentenylpyrophosphate transferase [Legionella quinlivanii]MCW8449855.1 tRNA (adenosine(37)-N6)-dimethylallyltransferase MiaA [Legionella quinlivanii]SEF41447.1 tRNA dimethylallyltransferase [Legionella quinlivanii DSM 21216]STY11993.1 tRNA delta(2)-isopentenylpyrophosphate transferase [Legionella quinlivanii]